jgi:hypothetical protein
VAAGEVARSDADRDRREQRREQRDQVQELLGPVERLALSGRAIDSIRMPRRFFVLTSASAVDELVHAGVVGVGCDRGRYTIRLAGCTRRSPAGRRR